MLSLGNYMANIMKDTKIYNIFPPELSDRGDYLGDLLPLGSTPSKWLLWSYPAIIKSSSTMTVKKFRLSRMDFIKVYSSRNKGILETSDYEH